MKKYFLIISISLMSVFHLSSYAQINKGGVPFSFSATTLSENYEVINLQPPDIRQFQSEDRENDNNNFPQRIATNIPVNIDINNSGTYEEIDQEGKIWRVKLVCDGAHALNVQFSKFHLPEGGKLFLYNPEKSQVLGAYTSINNSISGIFSTELIGGDEIIIEYFQPKGITELAEISISEIAYAYRNVSSVFQNTKDFGDSEWCQININCSPEGDNWQDEKRGVARILFKEGPYWYWCTGSLINNTLIDGTPYFLTADHCGGDASASDRNQWIFYFNYESAGCSNPGSSPSYNSLTGATQKSRGPINGGSDFQLIQLNSAPPSYYNVFYNGWDKSGSSSSSGVGIHHPAGDIKKISTYNTTLTSATWNGSGSVGAPNAHWRTYWTGTANGHGVSEGGSSGSPVFNSSGRILGTLTGGSSSCNNNTNPDLYGKFSYHWQSNGSGNSDRLKPWLDPGNSGVSYLDGYDPNAVNPPIANFVANVTDPSSGQTVNFTDLSTNIPTSWSWSFSPSTVTYVGGTNSSSQNPQVQFNTAGNYTVELAVSNAYGNDTETKVDYINASFYCNASGNANYLHVSNVQIGTIDNPTGQNHYSDFTNLSTDLTVGETDVPITIVNGNVFGGEDVAVWIDWDQDGSFYGSNEEVVCEIDDDGQGTFAFDVPSDASIGTTRMRIRIKYTGSDCGDPCGTTTYGEVEDYSINILASTDPPVADFIADDITPLVGQTVNFSDLSTNNPTSWSWSFSPSTVTYVGGTNSSSQNPQVQFDGTGSYTVELISTNTYGNDNETKTNYINTTLIYCDASGASDFLEIIRVQLGNIDNPSGQDFYSDFTYLSTDLSLNQSYDITITNADVYEDSDVGIWIDWNQNGNLDDAGENIVCDIDNWGGGTYSFTVPASALQGTTRMRIRTKYNNSDCGSSCGTSTYGEVEDYSVNILNTDININISVFLEGPFNGTTMETDIYTVLPLSQPYNIPPWNYSGTENVLTMPDPDIVDWIIVQLRDATSVDQATNATIISQQAAFIKSNGQLIDTSGNPIINFPGISVSESLFVAVFQRNHIAVISGVAITENAGIYTYDFSSGENQARGGNDGHKEIAVGVWGMRSGDADANGLVEQDDKDTIWLYEAGSKGYLQGDFNLDINIDNTDKNEKWLPNLDKGTYVPE